MARKDLQPIVSMRVSDEEQALLSAVSAFDNKNLSSWMRDILIPAAQKRIKELTPDQIVESLDAQIAAIEDEKVRRIEMLRQVQNASESD